MAAISQWIVPGFLFISSILVQSWGIVAWWSHWRRNIHIFHDFWCCCIGRLIFSFRSNLWRNRKRLGTFGRHVSVLDQSPSCLEVFDLILSFPCFLHSLNWFLSTSQILDASWAFLFIQNCANSISSWILVNVWLECTLPFVFFIFNFDSGSICLVLDLLHVLTQLKQIIKFVASLRHQVLASQFDLRSVVAVINNRAGLFIIDIHWWTGSSRCYLLIRSECRSGTLGVLSLFGLWTLESTYLWFESAVAHLFHLDKFLGGFRPLGALAWLHQPFNLRELSLILCFNFLSVSQCKILRCGVHSWLKLEFSRLWLLFLTRLELEIFKLHAEGVHQMIRLLDFRDIRGV